MSNQEPTKEWLRKADVLAWQPWVSNYQLRQWEKKKALKLAIGLFPRGDIWRKTKSAKSPRWYNKRSIKKICCGTNGHEEV